MPYALGAIPSPPDKRDFPAGAFLPAKGNALPDEYRLPHELPAYDQGGTSMCVDFSLRSLKELQEWHERGAYTPLANGYLYGNRGPDDYKGEGMYPREALNTLRKFGLPPASVYDAKGSYPYCAMYYGNAKERADPAAFPQRILSYVACQSESDVMGTIYHLKSPVAIVIAVTPRFSTWVRPDGRITPETEETVEKDAQGYHQMYIDGWKRDEFLWWHVVNSWGSWGLDGRCWIRADDQRIGEMWAVTDVNPIGRTVTLKIDDPTYTVVVKGDDGNESTETKTSDVAPFLKDNRTFLPVRAIAEALGLSVVWDEATQTVTIRSFT